MKVSKINAFFRKVGEWQVKHRWLCLFALLAWTLVCLSGMRNFRSESNNNDWIVNGSEIQVNSDRFKDIFGNDQYVLVLVQADDVFAPEVLNMIDRLGDRLESEVPFAEKVIMSGEFKSASWSLMPIGSAYKTDEIKRLPLPNKEDAERVESLREKIQRTPALEYDAPTVAQELGMSVSKLNRVFRAMYATSLHAYVQDKRLECAARFFILASCIRKPPRRPTLPRCG